MPNSASARCPDDRFEGLGRLAADVSGPVPPIAAAVAMMIEIEMNIGEDRPRDRVDPCLRIVVRTDATVSDRRRLVELHVRRDRGADERDDEEEELLVGEQMRHTATARPPSPSPDAPRIIAIGYVMNTSASISNTRST